MPQFRKKSVVVEAEQFTAESKDRCLNFVRCNCAADRDKMGNPILRLQTLEGEMTASLGDWIIKGVKGEFYPCKPDIFAATYELVADQADNQANNGEAGRGDAPECEPGDPRPTEKLKERRFNLVTVAPRTGRVNRNEKLHDLLTYLDHARQCGHTRAMLRGALHTEDVVILMDTLAETRLLREQLPTAMFVTLGSLKSLQGLNKPLLVDNHALHVLLADASSQLSEQHREVIGLKGQLSEAIAKKEEAEQLAAGLQKLAAKLLEDLGQRITDRADSSLPEWLREAQQLGAPARKCRHCGKIVTGPTEVCGGCTLDRM